jgi:hypothetical protein
MKKLLFITVLITIAGCIKPKYCTPIEKYYENVDGTWTIEVSKQGSYTQIIRTEEEIVEDTLTMRYCYRL